MSSETTVKKIYTHAEEFANRNGMDYWEAIRNVLYGARRDGRIFHLETAMGRKLETLQEVTDHDDGIFVVETINKPAEPSPTTHSPSPTRELTRDQIVEQILAVEVEELVVDCNTRVAHDLLYNGVRGIKNYTDMEVIERWNWLFAKELGYCVSIRQNCVAKNE